MKRWLIFFLFLSSRALCQQLAEGTIVDSETRKPVPFASIGIVGTSKGTSSNVNGQFSLSVTEPFSLKITCVGYESAIVNSVAVVALIELKPAVTQLNAIVILSKPIKAKAILQKAFANISKNYESQPFLQKFFYRHYCKEDNTYGRLIEASVDVWKNQGYRSQQHSAGEKEGIRVTQLRRSLDKTEMAQGHEPIAVGNILQADIVGYQTAERSTHLSFYTDVSNLKTDLESYSFTGLGITSYDGKEVYQISYSYKKDSALMTSGSYLEMAKATGTLYITTDTYAFIKSEEIKSYGKNTIHTSAYYQKFGDKYYPYHFIRDGESQTSDSGKHVVHIELMAVEIRKGAEEKFTGHLPGRDELLNIPYDSAFWASSTMLKTTPLEDEIIRDLGGGASLDSQFYHYHQYEMNIRDGGKNGEEKFNWFLADSKGHRILYLIFWRSDFQPYLAELELAKRLHLQYQNKITFVFLSLDDDEAIWQQAVQRFNLNTNGLINYRIGSHSKLTKSLKLEALPSFVLIPRNGEMFDVEAKRPSNPGLHEDFEMLLK